MRVAMFRDNKLRLLMTLVGFERIGLDDVDASWVIPSSSSSSDLSDALEELRQAESNPPSFDDGKHAEDLVRRKLLPRTRHTAFDEDSDGDNDEEFLFPAGGPTMNKADALQSLKKKRRSRRTVEDDGTDTLDEAAREARAVARAQADLERRRKIKSDLFIHDSDDEDNEERDEAFFQAEAMRREKQGREVLKALSQAPAADTAGRKRKGKAGSDSASKKMRAVDTGDVAMMIDSDPGSPEHEDEPASSTEDDDDLGSEDADTPSTPPTLLQSSQGELTARARSLSVGSQRAGATGYESLFGGHDDDDDEEDDVPIAKPARNRVRAGFIIESDSD